MYQALYRKWRPKTFDEVVGQKHITETLKNQVINGRLSHAYIFIGTRGTGKTTCARILAKAVNCEHPVNGNPCGECAACRGIADGSVLDVVEMDAASNNGVDNVRALREEAIFSPAAVKKRVYIIDEVHMLSTQAFNALLKILEEPPEHLMFILATTELQKVPATILSRCQRHQFHRIDAPEIAEYLRLIADGEGFELTTEAADLIARMADGGVRDALSLLDQCSATEHIDVDGVYAAVGLAGNHRIAQMLDSILKHDAPAALSEFDKLWMDGKDPTSFLTELSGLLRDMLMISVAPKGGVSLISGGYDMDTLASFVSRMTTEEIICAIDTLQRGIDSMRDARNSRTAAELCLVSLCDNTLGEDIKALRARVSRLEKNMSSGCFTSSNSQESTRVENDYDGEEHSAEMQDEPEFADADYDDRETSEYAEREDGAAGGEFFVDDIDPTEFAEEQPEDALLDRGRENNPVAEQEKRPAILKPEKEPDASEPVIQGDGMSWDAICDKVAPQLPFEVRFNIGDRAKVRGGISGGVLRIEAEPIFMYSRLNRSDILKLFSEAVSSIAGRSINTVISQLQPDRLT